LSDFDPAFTPSRGAWRDWSGDYLERQQAVRERREQIARDYREQAQECQHGRKRVTFGQGATLQAGLECKAGVCQFAPVPAGQVFSEWKAQG
jgi:hypothetical protein